MRTLRKLRLFVLIFLSIGALNVMAGDMKVMATLIWGTDDEKPAAANIKPASAEMAEQFRQICKWKHYFEITNTLATLPEFKTNRIRLSDKCEVDVANLGSMGLAAKLYGEGKTVYDGKSEVKPGKPWAIGGSGKDATAWFVILTPQK